MGFLDNKEEILNIVLTEHGKKALVRGEFFPQYYAFSDDEVDYQNKLENNTTGSEEQRFNEISDNWINFEPISSTDFSIAYNLYSVPLGQTYNPQLQIVTGSFSSSVNGIEIEKEIHIFENNNLADQFLREQVSRENIASIIKRVKREEVKDDQGNIVIPKREEVEIHIINTPASAITFDFIDFDEKAGFFVDVYLSESGGNLKRVTKEIKRNGNGTIVSDTYLKHFNIKSDIKNG